MQLANQYKQVLKLQSLRILGSIIVFAVMQIIISLGIAIGFTYLFDAADKSSILYLSTGAPTIVLIMTGLVILPNQITNARMEGHGEFLRTLPVNRAAIVLADTTIWVLVTIPGIIISTIVTSLIFNPGYSFSPAFILAYLLCCLTCIGIGYGFSYALPPMIAMALSQVIAFTALMFSPINFPIERLPGWLQVIHRILPIDAMAQVIRATMASSNFEVSWVTCLKLLVWCIVGYFVAIAVLNKK